MSNVDIAGKRKRADDSFVLPTSLFDNTVINQATALDGLSDIIKIALRNVPEDKRDLIKSFLMRTHDYIKIFNNRHGIKATSPEDVKTATFYSDYRQSPDQFVNQMGYLVHSILQKIEKTQDANYQIKDDFKVLQNAVNNYFLGNEELALNFFEMLAKSKQVFKISGEESFKEGLLLDNPDSLLSTVSLKLSTDFSTKVKLFLEQYSPSLDLINKIKQSFRNFYSEQKVKILQEFKNWKDCDKLSLAYQLTQSFCYKLDSKLQAPLILLDENKDKTEYQRYNTKPETGVIILGKDSIANPMVFLKNLVLASTKAFGYFLAEYNSNHYSRDAVWIKKTQAFEEFENLSKYLPINKVEQILSELFQD